MKIWTAIVAIVTFPGKFVVSRAPKMDEEPSRLLAHMVNYIFWLAPTIGLFAWLLIRHTLATI